jgi:hypothetical protein
MSGSLLWRQPIPYSRMNGETQERILARPFGGELEKIDRSGKASFVSDTSGVRQRVAALPPR